MKTLKSQNKLGTRTNRTWSPHIGNHENRQENYKCQNVNPNPNYQVSEALIHLCIQCFIRRLKLPSSKVRQ